MSHFRLSEFSSPTVVNGKPSYSKREQVPPRFKRSVERLIRNLDVVRDAIGKPMRVSSGWRSAEYNALSKGRATKSQHLVGKAADLKVSGVSPVRVYWVIRDLMDAGEIERGGLACYPGFVHYDVRGYKARWRKAPERPKRGLGS